VAPSGQARLTVALGRAGGQCGHLLTRKRRVFPFAPTVGGWVLQLDTRLSYVRTPGGPVVRIAVQIS
jgi:hypothetical protein